VLADISTVVFVALAVLTSVQWVLHRIRGAFWAALAFAILGGVTLTYNLDPSLVSNQDVAKPLVALLLCMPYCLFRFAASFRRPGPVVAGLALGFTVGIVVCTFALQYLPLQGFPPPPHFVAYRAAFFVQCGFLLGFVVIRFLKAGVGEPPIAAARMRLLAIAVVGLEVQVIVAAFWLTSAPVTLCGRGLARSRRTAAAPCVRARRRVQGCASLEGLDGRGAIPVPPGHGTGAVGRPGGQEGPDRRADAFGDQP